MAIRSLTIVSFLFIFYTNNFSQYIFSYLELGRLELIKNNYTEAIRLLNISIATRPDRHEAYFLRGYAKYNLDDLVGAEKDYTTAIEMFPPNKEAYLFRAIVRDKQFNFVGAFDDYSMAISFDSSYARAYFNRANTYLHIRDYELCLSDIEFAIKYKINDVNVYLLRGVAKSGLGKFEDAIFDYNRVINTNPFDLNAFIYRGISLMGLSRIDSAMSDFNFVLKFDSTNSFALYYRALCKKEIPDYNGALQDLDKVIELSPYNALAYFNKGLVLNEKEVGGWEVMRNLDKALSLDPDNILIYYNRGLIKYKTEDYHGALNDMNKLLEIYPDFSDAYYLRSLVKNSLNDVFGAKQDREMAIIINEKNNEKEDSIRLKEGFELLKLVDFIGDFISISDKATKVQYQHKEIQLRPFFRIVLNPETNENIHAFDGFLNKNYAIPLLSLSNSKIQSGNNSKEIELKNVDSLFQVTNNEMYVIKKALIYYDSQDYLNALSVLNNLLGNNYDDIVSRFTRANIMLELLELLQNNDRNFRLNATDFYENYLQQEDHIDISFENVINDYTIAIKMDPKFYFLYYNRAYAKYLSNDFNGAIDDFWEVLKINPDLADSYFNRGLLLIFQGEEGFGCSDIRKAGELGVIDSYNILKRYCQQ